MNAADTPTTHDILYNEGLAERDASTNGHNFSDLSLGIPYGLRSDVWLSSIKVQLHLIWRMTICVAANLKIETLLVSVGAARYAPYEGTSNSRL